MPTETIRLDEHLDVLIDEVLPRSGEDVLSEQQRHQETGAVFIP